jgi:hypothetical protein
LKQKFSILFNLLFYEKNDLLDRTNLIFIPYYWEKILKIILINSLIVPIIVFVIFKLKLVKDPFPEVLLSFQEKTPYFFLPLNKFIFFFKNQALIPAIIEELFFRGPIRILTGLVLLLTKNKNGWKKFILFSFVWIVGIYLNYQWASDHLFHKLIWVPIFAAGITWLWLVIRINLLWPAVFCHAAANCIIYFFIKIYQALN